MARTKADFTRTPWTTNQRYVVDSIPFPGRNQYARDLRREFAIKTLSSENMLYLYNINTQQEIDLKLIPDQMAESYSPKIATVSPFGVITPINFYTGGGEKTISFSFKMHEDLQGIAGSIYDTVQILQNMAKPVYRNSTLLDPLVYFQLGEQFVGMGHISTTFTYNKPFRNGRYTTVDVSMTFTFHEQFEDDPVVFNDTYVADLSPFAVDSSIAESNTTIDDFILFQGDPDYFITQVFGNQKFKTYFNTIVTSLNEYKLETNNRGFDEEEIVEFNESLESSIINPLLAGSDVSANEFFSNPFALSLIDLFFNLREVMFSTRSASINVFIDRFTALKRAVTELRNEYETSYTTKPFGSGTIDDIDKGIGWYSRTLGSSEITSGTVTIRKRQIQMSDAEKDAFVELLNFFESIVDAQITLYEGLRGAGN